MSYHEKNINNESQNQIMNEQEILNLGAKIGHALHIDNVKLAQVNKLLEILESEKDPKTAITILILYAFRQKSRKPGEASYIGPRAVQEISNAMLGLLNQNPKNKDEARKILGVAKWVYEALKEYRRGVPQSISDIRTLLDFLAGGRR